MENISIPSSRPIDPHKASVLSRIVSATRGQVTAPMLVGAFARDVWFWHMQGIETGRATEDLDISLQVRDWDAFRDFVEIVKSLGFEPVLPDHPEKLVDPETGQRLDLLPFGELSTNGRTIVWPPDGKTWSILGFEETYEASALMTLGNGGIPGLRVATLPALVLLKCVALYERIEDRKRKDGADIGFIAKRYLDIESKDRLLDGPDADIMDRVQGDKELAGCMLLGRDMGRIARPATRDLVTGHLRHETERSSRCPLAREVSRLTLGDFSRARVLLGSILEGMEVASRA
jgi:predicted nucleotidyltransferase